MITLAQLCKICPQGRRDTLAHFAEALKDVFGDASYNLDTLKRQAFFLAQAVHETQQFTAMRENLNYSAQGLLATFSRHFTAEEALDYQRQPMRIANHAYANRMGNGDEASGDGWRYRGAGIPHVTGKDNFRALSIAICNDADTLLKNPEFLEDPDYAVMSGAWYWNERKLYVHADRGDDDAVSDIINLGRQTPKQGDSNGFTERLLLRRRCELVLSQ